jgi:hypothetical protein
LLKVQAVELVVCLLVLIVTYVRQLRRESQCVKFGLRKSMKIDDRRMIYDRTMGTLERRGSGRCIPLNCMRFLVE